MKRLASGAWALLVAAACTPTQYAFVATALPLHDPRSSPLPEAETSALDGLTKHRWKTFSEAEACFESRLGDLRAEDILGWQKFQLMAFQDKKQPLATVKMIASSRVTVKDSSVESVTTEERRMPLFHVDVEVCFDNPGRVVMPTTSYVVLRVPYDAETVPGAGSRDGIWQLTH